MEKRFKTFPGATPGTKKPKFEIDYNDFSNTDWIKDFINKQLWMTGGSIQTSAGAVTNTKIQWGGQSRFLCGFNLYANNPTAHTISITLNQETIIDNSPLVFLQPLGNIRFIQYFEFIRPMSGNDNMVFSINSTVAEAVGYSIYMTRSYNRYYSRD